MGDTPKPAFVFKRNPKARSHTDTVSHGKTLQWKNFIAASTVLQLSKR